jgi:hypothetical protein
MKRFSIYYVEADSLQELANKLNAADDDPILGIRGRIVALERTPATTLEYCLLVDNYEVNQNPRSHS